MKHLKQFNEEIGNPMDLDDEQYQQHFGEAKPGNERIEGYYWVKFHGKWIPAEYEIYDDKSGSSWQIVACDEPFDDDAFDEIGPALKTP